MALVSVIVPNYNHAKYLGKRLDSILGQTFDDFEVIILDDCSADNSRDIIETYRQHPRVKKIVYNEVNSGNTFKQWQKGMDLSKGELIWIAESDDWAEPTFLEELIPPLVNNNQVAVAFCHLLCVDPKGKVLWQTYPSLLSEDHNGIAFINNYMLGANYICNASMAVFRKSMAGNISREYQNMRFCGDWFFWVQLAALGNVHICGKYLNYFLKHTGDVTSSALKLGLDFEEGLFIYKYIRQNYQPGRVEINKALSIIAEKYFFLKKGFLDDTVKSNAYKAILHIDPAMRRIMMKKRIKNMARKTLAFINSRI